MYAKVLKQTTALVPLLLWSVLIVAPLFFALGIALKTQFNLVIDPLGWPHPIAWNNILTAWQNANLGVALLNSAIITIGSVVGLVCIGSSAAYLLARRTQRWANGLYRYFILGLIVPLQLGLVPLYRAWEWMGLINTYLGVILIQIGASLPLAIFLFTGFIKSVPRELEEAAVLDGANQFQIFWRIVFPLLRPVTATVVILTSLVIWNDFLISLLFLQDQNLQTVPLAIYSFVGAYSQSWNLIFSSILVASLPIVAMFLLLQRFFIKGITGGALKG